jgi:hypothetical protein
MAGYQLGSLAYHLGGWAALTLFGAAPPVLALFGWSIKRREAVDPSGPEKSCPYSDQRDQQSSPGNRPQRGSA